MTTHPLAVITPTQRIRRGLFALLAATACAAAEPAAREQSLTEIAHEQFAFAAKQYAGLLKDIEGNATDEPYTVTAGRVKMVGPTHWTSGFFPGSLWLIYERTKEASWRAAAENYTHRLESIQHFTGHHDVGFMLGCSYGEGWRITGNPAYVPILHQGARSLATRYNPRIGLIRSWDSHGRHPVIIDNMMNLGLLWFAWTGTGDETLRDIVISHADKTRKEHFREDGSTYHVVDHDAPPGGVVVRKTAQGFADASTWARGQAWAVAGYATLARFTGDKTWLATAKKAADFVRHHPNLPQDGVPYWDFNDPEIPNTYRDASSGAVLAYGLLDLALQLGEEEGRPYRELAEKQLRTLASPAFRANLGENGHFLLKHSLGNWLRKTDIDVPLNYADYYFLKALAIILDGRLPTSAVP